MFPMRFVDPPERAVKWSNWMRNLGGPGDWIRTSDYLTHSACLMEHTKAGSGSNVVCSLRRAFC
jgi:hypothetical protein